MEAAPAPSEEVDGRVAFRKKPGVVGGAFVGEVGTSRKGGVDGEVPRILENASEDGLGGVRLEASVKHGRKVGRREVQLLVGGVRRGGGGGRIGRPHGRRARDEAE